MKSLYPQIAAVVSSFVLDRNGVIADAENLCPCKFDGNDADDCRVYGQLGDGALIPWYRASQRCLDDHRIKVSAIPQSTLEGMCDPPNANAFANYLKFDSGQASTGIKRSYGQFWDGDAHPVGLADSINGVDCRADAGACWTEIKKYFEANPSEIEANCRTLYNMAAKDLELEQSTVRISICNAEIASSNCADLQRQVEAKKKENPGKACSAFGLGPVSGGSEKPPVCNDGDVEVDGGTAAGSSSSARAALRGRMTSGPAAVFRY